MYLVLQPRATLNVRLLFSYRFAPLLDAPPNFPICWKNGCRFHYSFIAIFDSAHPWVFFFFKAETLSRMDLAYSAFCLWRCAPCPGGENCVGGCGSKLCQRGKKCQKMNSISIRMLRFFFFCQQEYSVDVRPDGIHCKNGTARTG